MTAPPDPAHQRGPSILPTVVKTLQSLGRCLGRADAGAVTAEFATILPVVAVLAVLLLSLARTVSMAMDCQDAAAVVARQLILVADDGRAPPGGLSQAQATARSVAGPGVTVEVSRGSGTLTVVTQCPVLPGVLGILPASVRGTATGVVQ